LLLFGEAITGGGSLWWYDVGKVNHTKQNSGELSMATFLLEAHSGWRYIVLVGLFVAIIKYALGFFGKSQWSNLDSTLNRVVPILVDVQWLLGLVLYVSARTWTNSVSGIAYWHPLAMTAAVVVSHIFSARVKKSSSDAERFQMGLIGNVATFVLIALGVYFVLGSWNLFGR